MAGKRHLRIIFIYALVVFAGEYVYLNILYLFGILYAQEGLILGYLSMVIMFVAFYLCLRHLNRKLYHHQTPILPLLINGLLLSVVSVLLTLLFHNIELYVLHTYPHTELFEAERGRMLREHLSETDIQFQLEKKRSHYFTFKSQLGIIKWYLKYGMLYTLVLIVFFKLKQLIKIK